MHAIPHPGRARTAVYRVTIENVIFT
jgi:hypothetical protein